MNTTTRRLHLGQVCATPGALDALTHANTSPLALLRRHVRGDWGDIPPEDAAANALALAIGARILSSYPLAPNVRIWVITEADRSSTTLLLPDEY